MFFIGLIGGSPEPFWLGQSGTFSQPLLVGLWEGYLRFFCKDIDKSDQALLCISVELLIGGLENLAAFMSLLVKQSYVVEINAVDEVNKILTVISIIVFLMPALYSWNRLVEVHLQLVLFWDCIRSFCSLHSYSRFRSPYLRFKPSKHRTFFESTVVDSAPILLRHCAKCKRPSCIIGLNIYTARSSGRSNSTKDLEYD